MIWKIVWQNPSAAIYASGGTRYPWAPLVLMRDAAAERLRQLDHR
jgi:hypothetical protein